MIEWIVGGLGVVVIAQAEYWIREHWTRCRERDAKLEKQARATRIAEKRRWIAEERALRETQDLYRQRAEQRSEAELHAGRSRWADEVARGLQGVQGYVEDTGTGYYQRVPDTYSGGTKKVWFPY